MVSSLFITDGIFNSSIYEQHESNGWKFLEETDPEQAKHVGFMLKSPLPVVSLTISYILFVCIIGPFLMRNREPFQLKTLIRFYNLFMVFTAGILFYKLYNAIESLSTLLDCSKIFTFSDESTTKIYQMSNLIIIIRISEYLDTIFFTLRKKQNQVTFLHVFHHAFVPMYAFWILKTGPLRFNVFIIVINSLIHILMYFYYFLATFQQPRDSSGVRNTSQQGIVMTIVVHLLKFKKYMTQLQILQFVALAIYAVSPIFRPNRCGVPWRYITANLLLAYGFLGLFLHFYINVYKNSGRSRTKRD